MKKLDLNRNMGSGILLNLEDFDKFNSNKNQSVDWVEVTTEQYLGFQANGLKLRNIPQLEKVAATCPITLHGIELSIGSVDPLDIQYLKQLKKMIEIFNPESVSDHLCWTGANYKKAHELLPLPYTEETIKHVVERVEFVQEFLGRRILLENPPNYVTYQHSEMTEWEFVKEIAERSDSGILLDINNLFVSSKNNKYDSESFLNGLPAERVAQFHLAGFEKEGRFFLDTHSQAISKSVWALCKKAFQKFGSVSVNIEWDTKVPSFEILCQEATKAKELQKHYGKTRAA